MFSFDTPLSAGGLCINLNTWQAFGEEYVTLDHNRTGNRLYLQEKLAQGKLMLLVCDMPVLVHLNAICIMSFCQMSGA